VLDLLGYVEPGHRAELSHAVLHLGLIGTLERLTAERWCPVGAAGATRRPTGEGQQRRGLSRRGLLLARGSMRRVVLLGVAQEF
jgi:hypothetical protein